MNVVELSYADYLANPQINPALIDIYQDSFGKTVSEAGFTRLIIASDKNVDILQYPIYIEAMCTIEDDGSIWNVCGSIHARSSGLVRRMLQYVAQPGMWLYVDFNNPYWNRAIGLYTAIGFSNPVAEDSYVQLVLDNSQDKIANRKLCNKLRRRYYKNHGYKIVKTLFKTEYLRFFEKLTRVHHREFGGAFGINNGEISTIPTMRTGKYIRQKHIASVRLIDASKYLCVFHTHPDATQHIILSPPSSVDLMYMVNNYDKCVTKHYIFESETLGGFWTLQLNPFARSVLETLSSFTLFRVELYSRLREIEIMFMRNISMDLDSTNYIKNTILNKYLTEINNLRLSSILKSIDDDSCLFFMEYIPWDSIPPEGFEDYIITSNPCGLDSEGLLLNQDLEGLQSVLMAMDASYNPDHWEGLDIVHELRRTSLAGLSSDDIIRQILDH